MKKRIFLLFLILVLLTARQEESLAKPPDRSENNFKFKIGVFGGIVFPLLPSELMHEPTTVTKEVQKSLLSGLDGLGYKQAPNLGLLIKCPIKRKFHLVASVDYSEWKSTTYYNCNGIVDNTVNVLSLLHFGLFSQNYFFENFYASVEISFNRFWVKVNDNSQLGEMGFSKTYPRIGAGLLFGYEVPLSDDLFLDLSVKGQSPNLLPGAEKNNESPISRTIINTNGELREATLFFLSLNMGILFSL